MNDTIKADAERFAGFLVSHYPPAREWEDPVGYCAWYIGRGYIAAVVIDGRIVALGAARPVDRPGFGVLPFYFNEKGKTIHIDILIDTTDDERAILALRTLTLARFGQRETVTMFRGDESAIHVWDYKSFWRKMSRIKAAKIIKKEKQNVPKRQHTQSA